MFSLRIVLIAITISYTLQKSEEKLIQAGSFLFWVYAMISLGLAMFAGVCSGLTVGFMALSKQEIELLANSDKQEQRKVAKPILAILEDHHLLLSTLLLSNALSLEALPIFLDKILPGWLAIIISTAAVVVFGEVIPQAYCTGPNKVTIAYLFSSFVRFMECLLYIFVKPIAYVLDNWLGHHEDKINLTPQNLKAVLYLHNKREYGYRPEEIEILQNTLDLRKVNICDCMIRIEDTFMLEENTIVDASLVDTLEKCNFSKLPVFRKEKSNLTGFVRVKNFLSFNLSNPKSLKESGIITTLVKLNSSISLLDSIGILKNKKINFAAIFNSKTNKYMGIITLKQIFEKLVLKEFKDNDKRVEFNWNQPKRLDPVNEAVEQD